MPLKLHLRNFLSHWGNWVLYNPVLVLLTVGILAIFAWRYTVDNLSINTDTAELIAPDAPFQKNRRNFEKAFSQDMHTLLLVIESATPELTKSAAKRLTRLLSADPANFVSVYIPNDNEFFRQNGLLYLDIDDLQTLTSNLSQAQPFIGRIAQEPDLNGFFSILQDAFTSSDKTRVVPIDLSSLLDKLTAALHKSVNGGNGLLSWETLIAEKRLKAQQANKEFIIVQPRLDFTKIRPAENAIHAIHKAITEIQEPSVPAVKVWVTGEVGLEHDELAGMSEGTFTASIFSVVLVCFILLVAYRSVSFMLATLITLAVAMIFCGVFAALSVKHLNLISVAFAVSNIGLGVEYGIHFCLRYQDNLRENGDRGRAIHRTLLAISPPLLLCAGTTAIGLYAFIPTDYKGVSELGLLAGTSLFISLFITLTVLPALLQLIPVSVSPQPLRPNAGFLTLSEKLATFTLHYAKPISLLTCLIAIGSIILVFKIKMDFNPINLRDPNTESVIAFKNLMKDKDTSPMTLTVMAKEEENIKPLQQKLSKLSSVDKTISLFDLAPGSQEDKLAMIEEMSLVLGSQAQGFPSLKPETDPSASIGRMVKTIDGILPEKTDVHEISALKSFKKELQDILIEIENRLQPSRRLFIEKVQTTLLGTLPNVMNELLTGFNAREITLDNLPANVKDRWLSKDGWYRIQIVPKKDLNDLNNLEEFITDVQSVAPEATDLPVMYWESMKAVIGAFKEAIAIALITITLLLYAIRRNLTDTLLVMTPLLLAGLFTMASTVISGTPINFANIIALPLLLGLGVDNGIHMVEKLRHSLSEEKNIYQSSTARAIFYGALTTSSSFAGLAFSPHQGIASMGLVITIGVFWIIVCTFIILPALSKLVLRHEIKYPDR
ncbi:Hopanoid biosynthesis associated RND transporter like protein HpnN [Candidatus Methylobacter favarea]|uniref:Hopanoid biosynthesis associated RND transporter like protein HpnN n=1 Tax=Candidatus Methylobacter favarea TaxID=2707345 RepID=A0A8S0Y6Y2_9GAMM|nr:MMPL family transporter [Candidatus Methylobacter favarea]CAA9892449.1 Hopanoid biosynthesis associated RND transporter like protein HpnN [Candidatus Methylobacter favarea]